MAEQTDDVVAVLDVGSQKVLCVVAKSAAPEEGCRVLGFGNVASEGILNGTVVNLEAVVRSIRLAVSEAAYTSGVPVARVWASIGGRTVTSANCEGTAVVRGNEVTEEEVELAQANAREHAAETANGRDLIKLIPQGFVVGETPVEVPLGLAGKRIAARVHAVYGSVMNAENLKRCMQRSELELVNYEPHAWAAAQAVLSTTEKICGTAVIDIGAQTTSIAVFREGELRHTEVCAWGAEYFTRDIAMVFGVSLEEAEELKLRVGRCSVDEIIPGEMVQAAGDPTRSYSRELLTRTLAARARELFRVYEEHIRSAGVWDDVELIVLTGGGASLRDIDAAAAAATGKRIRIGTPRWIRGETPLLLRPDAAVAMGLVRCALSDGEGGVTPGRSGKRRIGRVPRFLNRLTTIFLGDY